MTKFALVGAALLAMTAAALQSAVAQPVSWAGLYAGGNVGYSWGKSKTDVSYFNSTTGAAIAPPTGSTTNPSFNLDGVIAGLQLGNNWQNGKLVFGVEADIQWSGQKGTGNSLCAGTGTGGPCMPPLTFLPAGAAGTTFALEQKLAWFATLRGRLGHTITPTWLAYVTGGLAFGNIKTNSTLSGFTGVGAASSVAASSSATKTGWTLGVGVEGVISGKWTAKVEYLYMDLGTVSGSVTNTAILVRSDFSSKITDNILRVGLNYKLN